MKHPSTYRAVAAYYFYNGNKPKAKTYVNRGLRYVPDSRLLGSAIFIELSLAAPEKNMKRL